MSILDLTISSLSSSRDATEGLFTLVISSLISLGASPTIPFIVAKARGPSNVIDNEPFEDADNIENVEHFFGMSNEMKYPKYFNHYSISRLNYPGQSELLLQKAELPVPEIRHDGDGGRGGSTGCLFQLGS